MIAAGERLARWSIAHPQRAIRVMVALTLLALPGLLRLELRTDGHALVPPDDPAVRIDAEMREHFGLRDPVLVVVVTDHPDGIYNAATLGRLRELTRALAGLEGIGYRHVMSLATESRERLDPGTGLSFRSFLDPLPQTPAAFELLRQDLARPSAAILEGTLIAADQRAVAVVVEVPDAHEREGVGADRATIVRQIMAAAERLAAPPDRILVAGAPVAETLLGAHILQDLALLLPLALGVMALVLWLGCRRLWGVVLGLTEVGACLIFTFGVMGWTGVPIFLSTAILPVILTTLGLADEIHIYWHYQRLLAAPAALQEPLAALRTTLEQLTRPVVLTSLTTAIGFLSFAPSGVLPIFWLGLFAALGVLFCMVWSLTVLPAALALLPAAKMVRPDQRRPQAAELEVASAPLLDRLVLPLWRRRRWVLAGLSGVSLLSVLGLTRLFVYDSWIESFAPGSPFRRATEEVNQRLAGTHILQVELQFEPPPEGNPRSWQRAGPLLDPAAVDAVGEFAAFAEQQPGVGGTLSLHRHLTALAHFWQMTSADRVLPADAYDLDRLLRRFDLSRGLYQRLEVVDEELARTVVTIFVRVGNYFHTAELLENLRTYEREHLVPRCRLRMGGDLAVSQAMIPAIVRSQVSSVLLSLLAELGVLIWLYRSLTWGCLALLPAALSVLWVFGLMGFANVPLGVATSMFCAIALGIAVDFGIHFIARFRRAEPADSSIRAKVALNEVGPAIVSNTLLNALGFGVLMFSQVPANAHLGWLVAAALAASCILTLLGLGALLSRPHPRAVL